MNCKCCKKAKLPDNGSGVNLRKYCKKCGNHNRYLRDKISDKDSKIKQLEKRLAMYE